MIRQGAYEIRKQNLITIFTRIVVATTIIFGNFWWNYYSRATNNRVNKLNREIGKEWKETKKAIKDRIRGRFHRRASHNLLVSTKSILQSTWDTHTIDFKTYRWIKITNWWLNCGYQESRCGYNDPEASLSLCLPATFTSTMCF